MKSAYTVLGIPGNASSEEIEEALQRAMQHFSRDRLLDNPDLVDKLNEIKTAHKILSNSQMREAHDRKLRQSVARPLIQPVVVEERRGFGLASLVKVSALVAIALFAIGAYVSHARQVAQEAEAAQELAQKKIDEEAAAREAQEKEAAEVARVARDKLADDREQKLRADSLIDARLSSATEFLRQAAIARQAAADHNAELMEERRRDAEAQRKLAEYRLMLRRHY